MEAKLVAQHAFWMGKHGRILECKYLCVCLLCQTQIIGPDELNLEGIILLINSDMLYITTVN